jgi:DNA-binding NarL/FixJ family response regulator
MDKRSPAGSKALAQRGSDWEGDRQRRGLPAGPPLPGEPDHGAADRLSDREVEILKLMALGKTNRTIAEQLRISEGTVKTHIKHIFSKLDANNRTEAVSIGRSLQILT